MANGDIWEQQDNNRKTIERYSELIQRIADVISPYGWLEHI